MFKWFTGGDSNEKELNRLQPIIDKINQLEPEFKKLSDDGLRAKTDEFKARLSQGSSLDELLPEAYAAVREAAVRTIGQRHFDVQLMGGIVLHQGKIAEMRTGEGKTLVATLPLYLNSLTGKGVHLVTVNDYLARRDPYWMGPVYQALGVSVASIYPMQSPDERTPTRLYDPEYDSGDDRWKHFRPISRREAYQADITYGASSEVGFDYLRDNMVNDLTQCVQRPLNYAIVDEVDYLLIDEARTPLIISAPDVEAGKRYQTFARLVPSLKKEVDYTVDEKTRAVSLTEDGMTNMERMLRQTGEMKAPDLYDPANADLHRYIRNALNAKEIYHRDREYVVKDGQVIIVDSFTGRLMHGRRYSDGLHQAIEAKEHVKVQHESRTYATITIQNYFRMYEKLAGMTGTALTEAEEFHKIYKLEVVVIPTNREMIRDDFPDQIYRNEEAKFKAVVREIEQMNKEKRPVLIGTVSIENSEYLSDLLKRRGIKHHVLNAKEHTREGEIVAQAGQPGAVTVATNMAGRGVDIILGGNPEGKEEKEWQKDHQKVLEMGGLHIIGTERHEARRIDNQLRGRAGRQGDPGSSRFYISLEDDIVRRFGGDRIKTLMDWAGLDENTPIENKLVNRAVESAQVKVEGYHFDIRKHLVDYDDVVNTHRELIYQERKKILSGADLKSNILSMVKEEVQSMVGAHAAGGYGESGDVEGLVSEVTTLFPLPPTLTAESLSRMGPEEIEEQLIGQAEAAYEAKEQEIGAETMRQLERMLMLRTIDNLWVEHLTAMEHMRQGIGLHAVAQRDPLVAYKREGHNLFQGLLSAIQSSLARTIYRANIVRKEAAPRQAPTPTPLTAAQPQPQAQTQGGDGKKKLKVKGKKVGRNDPCPCGSGKKYKHCCGR